MDNMAAKSRYGMGDEKYRLLFDLHVFDEKTLWII